MSDPVSGARSARENLAQGLAALQAPGVPEHLMSVAEPIASAMSALHQIESTAGGALAQQGPVALDAVRAALGQLQTHDGLHPAVTQAMEAVAGSLGLIHSLRPAAPAPAQNLGGTVSLANHGSTLELPPIDGPAQQPAPQPPQAQPYTPQQHAPQQQQHAPQQYAPQQQHAPQQYAPPPQPEHPPAQVPSQFNQPNHQYAQPVPHGQPQQYAQPAPQAAPQYAQPAPPAQPQYAQPAAPQQYAAPPQAAPQQYAQPAPPAQPQYAQPAAPQQYAPPPQAAPPQAAPPQAAPPQAAYPQAAVAAAPAAAPASPQAAPAPAPTGDLIHMEAALGAHSQTNFYKGLSGNDVVDDGGIFVATYQIPNIGQPLALKVSMPGGYEFDAKGVVRWTREALGTGDDAPPGFGAAFTEISPEGRQLVYRYVRNREPLFHDDF